MPYIQIGLPSFLSGQAHNRFSSVGK